MEYSIQNKIVEITRILKITTGIKKCYLFQVV